MKRSRLRRASRARDTEREERRDVVMAVHVRDGYRCRAETLWPEIECGGPLDVHEPSGRHEGAHLDPDRAISVCRRHHDAIHHESPARAYELGLLERSRQ